MERAVQQSEVVKHVDIGTSIGEGGKLVVEACLFPQAPSRPMPADLEMAIQQVLETFVNRGYGLRHWETGGSLKLHRARSPRTNCLDGNSSALGPCA